MSSSDDSGENAPINEIFTHVHLTRYQPPPFVDRKYYTRGGFVTMKTANEYASKWLDHFDE